MELDRLLPLFIIWVIWRILNRKRKAWSEKTGAPLASVKEEMAILEPVTVTASFPAPSADETVVQPEEKQTVVYPEVRPAKRCFAVKCHDRDFLQQAVVWSEILAPPVSLRDDG
jgi:hypothetical protein